MGDFWPGNIMVALDRERHLERIYVLDWELSKYGLPGADVGQFCAEVHLLRRFKAIAKDSASRIISTFLDAYSLVGKPDISVCRDAIVHWGVHLAVWTPRIPWGDKATTRKVVEEGVRFLVEASSADEDWLRTSDIGAMFPEH
jgi:5-methylthioribose kinase